MRSNASSGNGHNGYNVYDGYNVHDVRNVHERPHNANRFAGRNFTNDDGRAGVAQSRLAVAERRGARP